jgi:hypothetical protein
MSLWVIIATLLLLTVSCAQQNCSQQWRDILPSLQTSANAKTMSDTIGAATPYSYHRFYFVVNELNTTASEVTAITHWLITANTDLALAPTDLHAYLSYGMLYIRSNVLHGDVVSLWMSPRCLNISDYEFKLELQYALQKYLKNYDLPLINTGYRDQPVRNDEPTVCNMESEFQDGCGTSAQYVTSTTAVMKLNCGSWTVVQKGDKLNTLSTIMTWSFLFAIMSMLLSVIHNGLYLTSFLQQLVEHPEATEDAQHRKLARGVGILIALIFYPIVDLCIYKTYVSTPASCWKENPMFAMNILSMSLGVIASILYIFFFMFRTPTLGVHVTWILTMSLVAIAFDTWILTYHVSYALSAMLVDPFRAIPLFVSTCVIISTYIIVFVFTARSSGTKIMALMIAFFIWLLWKTYENMGGRTSWSRLFAHLLVNAILSIPSILCVIFAYCRR